jgi:hypothetical protein
LFVMHACACHAFNATQVVGFRFAVLAPTPGSIQNLQCYKDIMAVSSRPVITTQAALDAMTTPAAPESQTAGATQLPITEENSGVAAAASSTGAEAGGASDSSEAGNAALDPESLRLHEIACGYIRDTETQETQAMDQEDR